MKEKTAIQKVSDTFKRFEGVSNKSATKMAYSLAVLSTAERKEIAKMIENLHLYVKICPICNNWYEGDACPVCSNPSREQSQLLVCSDYRLLEQIELTNAYKGLYHIIHDLVSVNTTEKTKQEDLIKLRNRIDTCGIEEVILGFDTNHLGLVNSKYVEEFLKKCKVTITTLSRGIPYGGIIEHYDLFTLEESIRRREPKRKK